MALREKPSEPLNCSEGRLADGRSRSRGPTPIIAAKSRSQRCLCAKVKFGTWNVPRETTPERPGDMRRMQGLRGMQPAITCITLKMLDIPNTRAQIYIQLPTASRQL